MRWFKSATTQRFEKLTAMKVFYFSKAHKSSWCQACLVEWSRWAKTMIAEVIPLSKAVLLNWQHVVYQASLGVRTEIPVSCLQWLLMQDIAKATKSNSFQVQYLLIFFFCYPNALKVFQLKENRIFCKTRAESMSFLLKEITLPQQFFSLKLKFLASLTRNWIAKKNPLLRLN